MNKNLKIKIYNYMICITILLINNQFYAAAQIASQEESVPTFHCASMHNSEVLKLAIQRGEKNIPDFKRNALKFALSSGHKELIEVLIEARANVNVEHGPSPLMGAVDKGRIDIAKLLINAGANIDALDQSGKSALGEAVKKKDTNMVKLLLESKADPDVGEAMGYQPPLFTAIASHDSPQITLTLQIKVLRALFETLQGLQPFSRSYKARMFLKRIAERMQIQILLREANKQTKIIELLLSHGCTLYKKATIGISTEMHQLLTVREPARRKKAAISRRLFILSELNRKLLPVLPPLVLEYLSEELCEYIESIKNTKQISM